MFDVFLRPVMYTLKKSLGQHFLHDDHVCRMIVDAVLERPFTSLVEVGPGGGALTRFLHTIPGIVFKAVELDHEKVLYLEKQYPALKGFVLEESILDTSLPFSEAFTVVGNFPYNISTQILFRMIEWREYVDTVVGMFQKEVALRVVAPPGSKNYGIPSVMIQAFFHVEYLFEVSEQAFTPPPKVKSAVIRLVNAHNPYHITDYRKLLKLVKAAFGQRRKQLRNPLRHFFDEAALKEEIFSKRAEQLGVGDYVTLMQRMK
jgi:16S rRNA (adenine1518-N6/adenine1519-N6)-dimethyltransferase